MSAASRCDVASQPQPAIEVRIEAQPSPETSSWNVRKRSFIPADCDTRRGSRTSKTPSTWAGRGDSTIMRSAQHQRFAQDCGSPSGPSSAAPTTLSSADGAILSAVCSSSEANGSSRKRIAGSVAKARAEGCPARKAERKLRRIERDAWPISRDCRTASSRSHLSELRGSASLTFCSTVRQGSKVGS